jgi:hypothetical protein
MLWYEMEPKGPEDTAEFLKLARSKSALERAVGIRKLAAVGDIDYPGAKDTLKEALNDPSVIVKSLAIEGIGIQGIAEMLPRIREIALSNDDPGVRGNAIRCLKMMPTPDSVYVVKELLAREEEALAWIRAHPDDRSSSYWWQVHPLLDMLWVLEGMQKMGEEFLTQNAIRDNPLEQELILYAMAWTRNKKYLKYAELVLRGKLPAELSDAKYGIIHAVRMLATYEEAKVLLEPLWQTKGPGVVEDPLSVIVCLRWKSERDKANKLRYQEKR